MRRLLAALIVAALCVVASSPPMPSTSTTTMGNVTKPAACNNHGTIPAGGWLANKSCGYVMGTAIAGTLFDVSTTTAEQLPLRSLAGR